MRRKRGTTAAFPVRVVIDTREQLGYTFDGILADARDGGGPLTVSTAVGTLPSGDYSLDGYAERVAVERKSLADLFHTIGQDRDRFERELVRLAAMEFAAVVVEGQWSDILDPQPWSQLRPKTVFRSVLAWQQRYPRVHWLMMPDREVAEITTFRILERFHRDHNTQQPQ